MVKVSTKKQNLDEEEQRPTYILKLHQNRFKELRRGQEHLQDGELSEAAECYSRYLSTLAKFFEVEKEELKPELFDPEKDLRELLLISNVYWDLAKIYDKNSRLEHQMIKCLEQFIRFTSGYKYQYANARMIKNYLKRGKARHAQSFKSAYEKIKLESGSCFISTYCFGTSHPITLQLRLLKRDALKSSFGNFGVDLYYRFSPGIVDFFERSPRTQMIYLPFVKIILIIVAKIHQYINSMLK